MLRLALLEVVRTARDAELLSFGNHPLVLLEQLALSRLRRRRLLETARMRVLRLLQLELRLALPRLELRALLLQTCDLGAEAIQLLLGRAEVAGCGIVRLLTRKLLRCRRAHLALQPRAPCLHARERLLVGGDGLTQLVQPQRGGGLRLRRRLQAFGERARLLLSSANGGLGLLEALLPVALKVLQLLGKRVTLLLRRLELRLRAVGSLLRLRELLLQRLELDGELVRLARLEGRLVQRELVRLDLVLRAQRLQLLSLRAGRLELSRGLTEGGVALGEPRTQP
mmetsp:Transcript_31258/g.67137  ORF Transcript_31258/g.67137 Transcript_31258/m.67137 type:complete len:283 (-) Transcript_31258:697-1545(-)